MDHLSSCYFCGTTMDDPLQDYRVVPVELRDDDDVTTATLCPSCHSKLERVLAPVVEAAGATGATLDARDSAGETGDSTPADATTESETTVDTTESGVDAAGADTEDGGTGSEEVATDDGDETGPADDELVEVDADLVDVDEDPLAESNSPQDLQDAMEPDVPDDLQSGDDSSDRETADGAVENERDTTDTTSEKASGDTESDSSGKDDEGNDPEDQERGGEKEAKEEGDDTDATAKTTVSALEYNKVMRLLQNREFPVDRAEIQTVAANAYGLAEHECAEVIDLAIDRGLIAERDGQLVRPG